MYFMLREFVRSMRRGSGPHDNEPRGYLGNPGRLTTPLTSSNSTIAAHPTTLHREKSVKGTCKFMPGAGLEPARPHRGLHLSAWENTLDAFDAAIAAATCQNDCR